MIIKLHETNDQYKQNNDNFIHYTSNQIDYYSQIQQLSLQLQSLKDQTYNVLIANCNSLTQQFNVYQTHFAQFQTLPNDILYYQIQCEQIQQQYGRISSQIKDNEDMIQLLQQKLKYAQEMYSVQQQKRFNDISLHKTHKSNSTSTDIDGKSVNKEHYTKDMIDHTHINSTTTTTTATTAQKQSNHSPTKSNINELQLNKCLTTVVQQQQHSNDALHKIQNKNDTENKHVDDIENNIDVKSEHKCQYTMTQTQSYSSPTNSNNEKLSKQAHVNKQLQSNYQILDDEFFLLVEEALTNPFYSKTKKTFSDSMQKEFKINKTTIDAVITHMKNTNLNCSLFLKLSNKKFCAQLNKLIPKAVASKLCQNIKRRIVSVNKQAIEHNRVALASGSTDNSDPIRKSKTFISKLEKGYDEFNKFKRINMHRNKWNRFQATRNKKDYQAKNNSNKLFLWRRISDLLCMSDLKKNKIDIDTLCKHGITYKECLLNHHATCMTRGFDSLYAILTQYKHSKMPLLSADKFVQAMITNVQFCNRLGRNWVLNWVPKILKLFEEKGYGDEGLLWMAIFASCLVRNWKRKYPNEFGIKFDEFTTKKLYELEKLMSANDDMKCNSCAELKKGKMDPADGEHYCWSCWNY